MTEPNYLSLSNYANRKDMPLLTRQEIQEFVEYNPETGIFVWKPRDLKWFKSFKGWSTWNGKNSGKVAGNINAYGYVQLCLNYKPYIAHRVAWVITYGEWPEDCIDHINGDKTDNRIANLRLADKFQNAQNRKIGSNNTSGVKGVHKNKNTGKWSVHIECNKERHFLGCFPTKEEAKAAYDQAARALHKEFASVG